MRSLLAVLVSATLIVAPARAADPMADILVPTPVGIILSIGKFLITQGEQVYYIRVRGIGVDQEQALGDALRTAVNRALGAVVMSQRQTRAGAVVENETLVYSSGYVKNYDIVESRSTDRGLELDVDVWVRSSQIADRLLYKNSGSAEIDGAQAAQIHRSFSNERDRGDRAVDLFLRDFPRHAFDVRAVSLETQHDDRRGFWLIIDYEINWKHSYITALKELLSTVSQNPNARSCWDRRCGSRYSHMVAVLGANDWYADVYGFTDPARADRLLSGLVDSDLRVSVTLRDSAGRVRRSGCVPNPSISIWAAGQDARTNPLLSYRDRKLWIQSKPQIWRASVFLGQDPRIVADLQEVDIKVLPKAHCSIEKTRFSPK